METTQMGQEQNLGQEQKEEEEEEEAPPSDAPTEPQPSTQIDDPPVPAPPFDPSRMIGIIRRKSLIKELAAMYHAECLSYCQELLELQRKGDEKDAMRPPKRLKKTR
ncbi:hypothetical protein M0R45_013645 [Rubus argutus]|uniref:Uncharacterized protein n=1 Tax=Rubus argutus TaxID=59490 RepID=A0AAW1XJG2_RUBAR